jgi:hypothetical protein
MRTSQVTVLHPSGVRANSTQPRWKRNASVANTRADERFSWDEPHRHRDLRGRVARQQRRVHSDIISLEVTKCTAAQCAERRQGLDKCACDGERTTGASQRLDHPPNLGLDFYPDASWRSGRPRRCHCAAPRLRARRSPVHARVRLAHSADQELLYTPSCPFRPRRRRARARGLSNAAGCG